MLSVQTNGIPIASGDVCPVAINSQAPFSDDSAKRIETIINESFSLFRDIKIKHVKSL